MYDFLSLPKPILKCKYKNEMNQDKWIEDQFIIDPDADDFRSIHTELWHYSRNYYRLTKDTSYERFLDNNPPEKINTKDDALKLLLGFIGIRKGQGFTFCDELKVLEGITMERSIKYLLEADNPTQEYLDNMTPFGYPNPIRLKEKEA